MMQLVLNLHSERAGERRSDARMDERARKPHEKGKVLG
jgi:hypothetical protein